MVNRLLTFVAAVFLFGISSAYSSKLNDRLLSQLDKLIESKDLLHSKKEDKLVVLKSKLGSALPPQAKFAYNDTLFHEYLHYQADSAMVYLRNKEKLIDDVAIPSKRDELKINCAEVLGVMGMYDDALALLKTVNSSQLNRETCCYYYRTCRACYGWLADYSTDSNIKQNLLLKTQDYRDSILTIIPAGIERECVWAEKQSFEGNSNGVLQHLTKLFNETENDGSIEYIYLCFTIAEIYELNHDIDNEIHYLTLTAIGDMNASIREYASLQKLAQKMYEIGDVSRAYTYLSCSLEDAVECNARLRSIEVTQIYPIIEKKYKDEEIRDKHRLQAMIFVLTILSVLLLVALVFLYRWMKKLSRMRRDLAVAYNNLESVNVQLANTNEQLAQTGRIKEAYIARYIDQCVTYLDKLETYRNSLAKLAMASRVNDLYKAIKSEDFIVHERKEFYNEFDKSFLSLFPHFVDDFNALLQEDARIQPKSSEMLTTELRIFALIRLGITDSNRIAHFLRYSLTTIYNYRSKLRNKAIDKENFEQNVLNL